jgi:hypothetical protein
MVAASFGTCCQNSLAEVGSFEDAYIAAAAFPSAVGFNRARVSTNRGRGGSGKKGRVRRGLLDGGLGTFDSLAFQYIQPRTVGLTVAKQFD